MVTWRIEVPLMPVFFSRRGSQNRTFQNLTGSVVVVFFLVFALIFAGRAVAYADDATPAAIAVPDSTGGATPDSSASAAPDSAAPPTLIPDTTWESANQVLELP